MRSIWFLVFAATAMAQDPGAGPMDIDIDLDDIDLSGPEATPLSYSGGFTQRNGTKTNRDAAVTISNPAGTTTVYCTDTEEIDARVNYTIEGSTEGPVKAFGDGIRLGVTGGGASGRVSLVVPSRSSAIKTANIALVANVPKEARVTVTSPGGTVTVSGCDGTVSASSRDLALVDGKLRSFNVTSSNADARVTVTGDGKIGATSAITASKGAILLTMPMSQDVKIDARGSAVSVAHLVTGTNDPALVSGTIGAGGPALTLRAGGEVSVRTP